MQCFLKDKFPCLYSKYKVTAVHVYGGGVPDYFWDSTKLPTSLNQEIPAPVK